MVKLGKRIQLFFVRMLMGTKVICNGCLGWNVILVTKCGSGLKMWLRSLHNIKNDVRIKTIVQLERLKPGGTHEKIIR